MLISFEHRLKKINEAVTTQYTVTKISLVLTFLPNGCNKFKKVILFLKRIKMFYV